MSKSEAIKIMLLPPTYLFVAIVTVVILHFICPGIVVVQGLYRLLGLLPMAIGIALNLTADRFFKIHQTTVKPFDRSRVMITEGVFRWSRNPMYLGMVLILLGIIILLGSVSPLLVLALFMVLLDVVFIQTEEAKMEHEFGEEFQQYRQQVRRWI
ncbi:methyltransferase family protein [Planctomycetota bacterium]